MVEIEEGLKLDCAVAEAVGLKTAVRGSHEVFISHREWDELRGVEHPTCEGDIACITFAPSDDLNDAFAAAERAVTQVWEKDQRDWGLSIYIGRNERGWTCSLGCDEDRVFAATPAMAICAAILKLKESHCVP